MDNNQPASSQEGVVTISITPTIRRRLKNKAIELRARNYSQAIGEMMDRLELKDGKDEGIEDGQG